jgi:hypothetical protein
MKPLDRSGPTRDDPHVTTPRPVLVRAAARNNAEWCAAVSRSHGLAVELGEQTWTAPARTPLLYPDAVTLVPGADQAELVARIDTDEPGASVKDSFADLELAHAGFGVLFEAQWIHRRASAPTTPSDLSWTVVDSPAALRAWALAWDDEDGNADLFRPALLDDPTTFVLAGQSDGSVVAGAVASRSDDVLGISNLFALDGRPDTAWPLVLDAANQLFPDLPVVGYAQGDGLSAALRHGFETVGPLRVWLHGW